MIKRFSILVFILLGVFISGEAQVRDTIRIPDTILFNPTDIPIGISRARGNDPSFEFFRTTTVPAGGYRSVSIYIENATDYNQIELLLNIDNFLVEPGKGLPVTMTFVPDNICFTVPGFCNH